VATNRMTGTLLTLQHADTNQLIFPFRARIIRS
jgi:hypothetical protein